MTQPKNTEPKNTDRDDALKAINDAVAAGVQKGIADYIAAQNTTRTGGPTTGDNATPPVDTPPPGDQTPPKKRGFFEMLFTD